LTRETYKRDFIKGEMRHGFKKTPYFSNAAIIVILLDNICASFIFMFVLARIHDVDLSYNNVKKLTQIQYEFFKAEGDCLKIPRK